MRPELLVPEGEITDELLSAVLSLVSVTVQERFLADWTELERVLAYDWAMREHLAASDCRLKRRPRPWLVTVAAEQDRRLRVRVPAGGDRSA